MFGIWVVCQVTWLYHLSTGHPYCPVFTWIRYSGVLYLGVQYSDGYCSSVLQKSGVRIPTEIVHSKNLLKLVQIWNTKRSKPGCSVGSISVWKKTRNGPFACANVRGDQRTATAMGLQKPTRPRYAPVPRAPEVPPLLVQQVAQKQIWGRLQPGLRGSTRSVVVAGKYSNDQNFIYWTGNIQKPDFY